MDISFIDEHIDWDELCATYKAMTQSLIGVHFPRVSACVWGEITGYDIDWESPLHRCLVAYYQHNIAVVGENLPNPEHNIAVLQKLGYHVPERKMRIPTIKSYDRFSPFSDHDPGIDPEEILWDELRTGRGWSLVKSKLERLLVPVLKSVQGARKFEFAVYNPDIFESSDNASPIPPYIEYDELFSLPTIGGGC
jgi:hypothetical protein